MPALKTCVRTLCESVLNKFKREEFRRIAGMPAVFRDITDAVVEATGISPYKQHRALVFILRAIGTLHISEFPMLANVREELRRQIQAQRINNTPPAHEIHDGADVT